MTRAQRIARRAAKIVASYRITTNGTMFRIERRGLLGLWQVASAPAADGTPCDAVFSTYDRAERELAAMLAARMLDLVPERWVEVRHE